MTNSAGPPPRPEDAAGGDDTQPIRSSPWITESIAAVTATPSSAPSSTPTYGWNRSDFGESGPSSSGSSAYASDPYAPITGSRASRSSSSTTAILTHVDPWTVTRHAFAFSVALMGVAVVAAAVLWMMLAMSGVWTSINNSMGSVLADDSGSFDITDYLGFGRMITAAMVLGAINVVFMTALGTIGAHIYNLIAAMSGGIEVTLSEE